VVMARDGARSCETRADVYATAGDDTAAVEPLDFPEAEAAAAAAAAEENVVWAGSLANSEVEDIDAGGGACSAPEVGAVETPALLGLT
jgi:hypothetical protein